jgi:predicted CoA-substrate-specific enzyme activase
MYVAGLDIGSAFSKAVILANGALLAYSVRPTSGNFGNAADIVLREAVEKAKCAMPDLALIGACGIGAAFIPRPFTTFAESSCHGRGVHHLMPSVRTLIEVGNMSASVMKITAAGKLADCLVSDKCAAGSGRILHIIARMLKVNIEEFGKLSKKSTRPAHFTTNCAVFLETEAISRVAEGTTKENIIAGLHRTLGAKISTMVYRVKIDADCIMTGGAALDSGLVAMTEEQIGQAIRVTEHPMITGAIGAALIAAESGAQARRPDPSDGTVR